MKITIPREPMCYRCLIFSFFRDLVCCVSATNVFGCACYFVVECYGGVECEWRCSVGYTVYGFQRMCVCCACYSNVHLDAPSISLFMCVYVGSNLLMLFPCMIFNTMWSCKSRQLLYILPFGILRVYVIILICVKIILAVCMLLGIVSSVICVQSVF